MNKLVKKLRHNTLFGFILGGIVFSSIVYGINTYESNSIEYSPTDESWEVSNVNEAINSLHGMQQELDNIKSLGDAIASDIAKGKTAVVKGELITGSNNGGNKVIKLGSGTTFNLKTLQEEGKISKDIKLDELTSDNFIVEIISLSAVQSGIFGSQAGGLSWYASASGSTISKNYDSTSFSLTISGYNQTVICHRLGNSDWPSQNATATQNMTYNVYLVSGEINTI